MSLPASRAVVELPALPPVGFTVPPNEPFDAPALPAPPLAAPPLAAPVLLVVMMALLPPVRAIVPPELDGSVPPVV
jgi:hypothetical protein